jgi:hypothetical protein
MNYRFVMHGMSTLRFGGFRPHFGEPPESHVAFKFVKLSCLTAHSADVNIFR